MAMYTFYSKSSLMNVYKTWFIYPFSNSNFLLSAVHRADHRLAACRVRPARAQEPHLRLRVADLGQPLRTVEALHQVQEEEQARLLRQRRPLAQGTKTKRPLSVMH